jgi:hypothetical protein
MASACPAHDDNKASLSISEGRDGKLLLNCFAGCSFESIVQNSPAHLRDSSVTNARPERVAPLQASVNVANSQPRTVIAEYCYVDEDGALLYVVERHEPKDFRQKRPDVEGGWKWNLAGVRRVPYHLPQLIAAIKNGETVLIVEGEMDVESAASLGYIATTSAGGGAWAWTREFCIHFLGASVLVVADNDEPGKKAARDRAQALLGTASQVRIIEQLPEVGEKGDISELIARGWEREQLDKLFESAPVFDFATSQHETHDHVGKETKEKRSQASQAADLVKKLCSELVHDSEEIPYAIISQNGVRKVYPIRSSAFKGLLLKSSSFATVRVSAAKLKETL